MTCNGPVLFIASSGLGGSRFNESPFILAGQESLSLCAPVRVCEEEIHTNPLEQSICFNTLKLRSNKGI